MHKTETANKKETLKALVAIVAVMDAMAITITIAKYYDTAMLCRRHHY